ncbi:MAG: L-threonylcarbamoyladenylate synthase [Halioglobus sp.]
MHLKTAVDTLCHGGVIACPTEAVWGLSCDPYCEDAVEHLLTLKMRPAFKGLILVAASQEQVAFLLGDLSEKQAAMLSETWPGPNTWLVPHQGLIPENVCGDHEKVAVRVSAHPVVKALCESFGGPLVSTSANRAGARPALHAFQVRRYFGDGLDYVLPGRLGARARPSTIRDLASGEILRD